MVWEGGWWKYTSGRNNESSGRAKQSSGARLELDMCIVRVRGKVVMKCGGGKGGKGGGRTRQGSVNSGS